MRNKWIWIGLMIISLNSFCSASPVPETGLTQCYNLLGNVITCPSAGQAFYGQDANYTINPMSYTKLDGSGNALSDSAVSWAMVRDNVTDLIWEVKTSLGKGANYNDPHNADNYYYWYDSNPVTNGGDAGSPGNGKTTFSTEDFIKALNTAHYGGYTDWRMPSIQELKSIARFDMATNQPNITSSYFPNSQVSLYWSSTTYTLYPGSAWGESDCDTVGSKNGYGYTRAVRGGKSKSAFVNNSNGTVTDNSTGLMWQQATGSGIMDWDQALSYCENLSLAGFADWRLPNQKELESLVDFTRINPAINITYFPNTISDFYWSCTTYVTAADFAWGMYFNYGGDYGPGYKAGGYYVRAVRGGRTRTANACTATLDDKLWLNIPFIDYSDGNSTLSATFSYTSNPSYPALILFKLVHVSFLNNLSYSCTPSTITGSLSIFIPDLLLSDGKTHLWVDLTYNPVLSINGNYYWVVSSYGLVSS
jgi:hypothetical protein